MRLLDISPRYLLIFFALGFQVAAHLLSALSPEGWQPFFMAISFVLWLVWFAIVFAMAIPSIDGLLRPHLKRLKFAALGICIILCSMGIIEIIGIQMFNNDEVDLEGKAAETADAYSQDIGYNDSTAMVHVAGEKLLEAKNPYTEINLVEIVDRFDLSAEGITPLREGEFADISPYPTEEELELELQKARATPDTDPAEFETKIAYPSGSFIFPALFLALGIDDLRFFYFLCALATFGIIMWQAPRKLWPLVVIVALVSLEIWSDIAFGGTGSLYFLFLLLAWILIPRNLWLSAVFMGLAVTTKQLSWFFLPFYLVLLFRHFGWQQSLKLASIIFGVFFLSNIPFILSAPQKWTESVLAPLTDPMFPYGVGIVSFSAEGLVPLIPSMIYAILEVGVLIAGLYWYYHNCRKYPAAGIILAVFPLFFAWRSFSIYFSSSIILVFAIVLASSWKSFTLQARARGEVSS